MVLITILHYDKREFLLLQEKLAVSGMGIMKFLRQEKINHSTYIKWRGIIAKNSWQNHCNYLNYSKIQ